MANTTLPRWLTALWLLISQLAGAILALAPITVLAAIAMLSLSGGGMPTLFGLACLSILLPASFAVTAWIAFARRKNRVASILSGICLFLGALLYFAMDAYTRYLN